MQISLRKAAHIKYALDQYKHPMESNWLECVKLVHHALPSTSWQKINIETAFLNIPISSPIIIGALTGGTLKARKINYRLAEFAQKEHIPMMLGSQRVMLEKASHYPEFTEIRKIAPDIPLIGNIGIGQLCEYSEFTEIFRCFKDSGVNGCAVHLNPLQELLQPEGDHDFSNSIRQLSRFLKESPLPVIIKEVGNGLSSTVLQQLQSDKIKIFDAAGFGGTNFIGIEQKRAKNMGQNNLGAIAGNFTKWGIPTAASVLEIKSKIHPDQMIIASGGIRTGIEVAQAFTIGANYAGMANPFLYAVLQGKKRLESFYRQIIKELKIAMMVTNAVSLKDLNNLPKVLLPPLSIWKDQRQL